MQVAKWQNYLKYLITGPMFYMGGGSAPTPPDPYKTADSQIGYNRKQTAFDAGTNRYTQNNPFGTVSWQNSGTAENPQWMQNTTLSQPQQQLYDTQLGTQNQLAGQASDYAGRLQGMLSTDPSGGDMATRSHVEQGLMDRLNPYLERDQNALQAQLANQGLTYGGEAYGNAMQDQSKRVNDARLAVIAQGGQEMQRAQQMDMARRNQGLTEMGALMQGSGNVNMPTYGGATTLNTGSAPDIAGLINQAYQGQVSNYNADQAGKNGAVGAGLGALGTIGGGFAGNGFKFG
jgi:hypothetical protein